MEIFGWISSILFAFCGLPQAIKSVKTGRSDGLTWGFILMWLGGEIFAILYILPKSDLPLLFNYSINMIFLLIICAYKILPKPIKKHPDNF